MQQIQLVKYRKLESAFQFKEASISDPTGDEVQIEVERFGLNFADVMAWKGLYREVVSLPTVLGYEVVGKVVKLGANASTDLLGKKVVAFTRFGGYSQYVNTSSHGVVPIGDYDANKALCLATQYVTAYYMCAIATTVSKNDNVLIHNAAGGVGTALLQLLKHSGATLIAKTSNENKYDYIRAQGVHHIVNYKKSDYARQIEAIIGKRKLDISYNPIAGSTYKKDFHLLRQTGCLVLFGASELSNKWGVFTKLNFVRKMGMLLPISLMMQSKGIIGVNMLYVGDKKPLVLKHCLETVVKMGLEGKIDPQIGGVFKATEIVEAHRLLNSGKSIGKIVVEW